MQREKEENMGGLGGEGGRSCTLLHHRQRINYLRADRRRLTETLLDLIDINSFIGKLVVLRFEYTPYQLTTFHCFGG